MYSKYLLLLVFTYLILIDAKYIKVYEDFQILGNIRKTNISSKIILNNNQYCTNINKKWSNKISSINTNNNLIRIYSNNNCTSSSVIIKGKYDLYGNYTVNNITTNLKYYNDNIRSIRLIKK